MNVLSLFDGISCARVALGNKVRSYYASEIDKNAIKVSKKNFPSSIHLGDVKGIKEGTIKEPIDLLIGGSPCTDLSIGKKDRKGLEGDQSKLFYEYIRIKNLVNPKWFILENVASMPKKDKDIITKLLGVEPIMIDASLVSAQSRKRYFWTNIPNVRPPEDRHIQLQSVLQKTDEIPIEEMRGISIRGRQDASGNYVNKIEVRKDKKVSALTSSCSSKLALIGRIVNRRLDKEGKRHDGDKDVPQTKVLELRTDGKSGTLTHVTKDNVVVEPDLKSIRRLTPIECERLQGLPDNYTDGIPPTARYRAIGNAFHTEVIKHIINQMPPHATQPQS